MALSLFGRSWDDDFSLFDPFRLDSFLWDFPRRNLRGPLDLSVPPDVAAVANVQVDWKETPEAHIIKANLPGMRKDEVKVQVLDGRVLQVSGERKKEEVEETDRWHRVERAQGSFSRSFRLPENAKLDEIKATMEDGVLTIKVPKVQEAKPAAQSIEVTSGQ